MSKFQRMAALAALCGAVVVGAHAQEVRVYQAGVSPTVAYDHLGLTIMEGGTAGHGNLLVGRHTAGTLLRMRAMLAFDLSDLPERTLVQSIEIEFKAPSNGSGNKTLIGDVDLYELEPGGSLANELNDDATWPNYRTGTAWTTGGGDFGTKLQTITNANLGWSGGQTTTVGTSAELVAAAQAAIDGDRPLQMVVQAPTAEANVAASNYMRWGRPTDATTSNRPKLTVTYIVRAAAGTVVSAQ